MVVIMGSEEHNNLCPRKCEALLSGVYRRFENQMSRMEMMLRYARGGGEAGGVFRLCFPVQARFSEMLYMSYFKFVTAMSSV